MGQQGKSQIGACSHSDKTRALSLPHRVWRALPVRARRQALTTIASRLAPHPERVPPPYRGETFAIGGAFTEASGLGESARLLSLASTALGLKCLPVEMAIGRRMAQSLPDQVPLVLNINPAQVGATLIRARRDLLRGRMVIGYFPCELPVPPPSWRAALGFVHHLWCPSRFSAAAFEAWAPGRVSVVPHPVALAPPVPSDLTRADFGWPENAIVVLVSFSLASSFERKNPLAAIAAFRKAFDIRNDRLLVLKVSHVTGHDEDLRRLREAIAGTGNIVLDSRTLPRGDAHAMTRAADIVLSLHRSEGFGLVPAEAMLLGRAVVATDWSGTTDFLDAGCGVPIPYRLVPAHDPRGVFEAPGAYWAQADIGAAASALRMLADDAGARARLGSIAKAQAMARLGGQALLDAAGRIGIIPDVRASI